MRRFRGWLLCAIVGLGASARAQLPPIGQWREHLSYHHATGLAGTAQQLFVSTPYAVFSVTGDDHVLQRYSTLDGLHDIGVSALAMDTTGAKVVIGYNNSDVDVLSQGTVTEVPDLELSSLTGDKTIHSIYILGDNAYLSTGLGIVVLNTDAYQVQATYIIGNNGDQASVQSMTSDAQYFYAATSEGLKKASLTATDLQDFASWTLPVGDPLMAALPCTQVLEGGGLLFVLRDDSVFSYDGNAWATWYTDSWNISGLQYAGGLVEVCEDSASIGRVLWVGANASVTETLEAPGTMVDPRSVYQENGEAWVADAQRGLLFWNGTSFTAMVPNSPDGPLNGQMTDVRGQLWVAGGAVIPASPRPSDTSGFYSFIQNQWNGYNSLTLPVLEGITDIGSIAVSPKSDTVFAGSATGGLIQWYPAGGSGAGGVRIPATFPVTGLTFDSTGDCWIVSSGATQPLLERKPGGALLKYSLPVAIPGNVLGQVIIDDYHYLWIIAPGGNGILCFNPSALQWVQYMPGAGLGNLPDPNVNCVAMDHQGLVWIGTNNGIGVVECGYSIFNVGCDATWPIVQDDQFAGYLFEGQQVLSIAVDGADRKWVGTTSGAWLISEDGIHVLQNLTSENSPLFNDTVNNICIDGTTGEVFFSTPEGMCSYRGNATAATDNVSGLLVFPNPVPPGYSGTIAIRGVPDAAIVKIIELDGRLVYQTVALGGQAIWDGNDYTGHRVASGVYLVLIADQNNQVKASTKIVFIH